MAKRIWFLKNIVYFSLVIAGMLFMFFYIHTATMDLPVLNDYIREINRFVGNGKIKEYVFSTAFILQPPVNLLMNWINYNFLDFSVTADMFLGVLGLTLEALVFAVYSIRHQFRLLPYAVLMFYTFSLTKWEMVINGTGWVHFWAFFGFALHFYLMDLWYHIQEKKQWIQILMVLIPTLNILGFAMFYGAVYAFVSASAFFIIIVVKKKEGKDIKNELVFLSSIVIPIMIYIICSLINHDTRITGNESFFVGFVKDPMYFIGFFVMSFSSEIIGIETVLAYSQAKTLAFIIGFLVLCLYVFCLIINIIEQLYHDTYIPLLLLSSGFCSHGIVLVSRWGFDNIMYGMSSRYALQYLFGGIGILLTMYFWFRKGKEKKIRWLFSCLVAIALFFGNMLTTVAEIQKAPYRKAFYNETKAMIFSHEKYTDEQLSSRFCADATDVRNALLTIKKEKLSVWAKIPCSLCEENTLYGRYADGWLDKKSEFLIASGEEGVIELGCYYPFAVEGRKEIEIEVDYKKSVYSVQEGYFILSLPCKENEIVDIKICTNFSISDESDIRERSFVLSSMEGK